MNPIPLGKILQEEMAARGWTDADIEARVQDAVDQCAVFLAIYIVDKKFILDERTAAVLSRIFDVSEEFLMNLNKAWRETQ